MKIICSYCRKELGEKEPLEDEGLTHSICPECYDYFREQFTGLPLDKYLDHFDQPVLIVDSNARVVAANRQAQDALGKAEREVAGFLGGEVLECVYAKRPEGCGCTEHCAVCTLRNMVNEIMETGQSVASRNAYLDREDRKYTLVISARKEEGLVVLTIEDMY